MTTQRLDIRLDRERRQKLSELAQKKRVSISELIRAMIDREYEAVEGQRRIEAAGRIAAMQIEDVPDPETLSRQLESAHEPGLP
jgi:hypothetical protein